MAIRSTFSIDAVCHLKNSLLNFFFVSSKSKPNFVKKNVDYANMEIHWLNCDKKAINCGRVGSLNFLTNSHTPRTKRIKNWICVVCCCIDDIQFNLNNHLVRLIAGVKSRSQVNLIQARFQESTLISLKAKNLHNWPTHYSL